MLCRLQTVIPSLNIYQSLVNKEFPISKIRYQQNFLFRASKMVLILSLKQRPQEQSRNVSKNIKLFRFIPPDYRNES